MPILTIEPGEACGMAAASLPPFGAWSGAPMLASLPALLLMPGGDPDEESEIEEDDLDDEEDEDDLDEDEDEDDLEDDEESDEEDDLEEDEEEE